MQALLELDCFPAGMELFPSSDDDQWTLIKRESDHSDYYLVIVTGKYSSLSIEGFSYTEREYDYAFLGPRGSCINHDANGISLPIMTPVDMKDEDLNPPARLSMPNATRQVWTRFLTITTNPRV